MPMDRATPRRGRVRITIPATATGRLMKKIQRQLAASISTPPTSGPMASATAETAAQIPSARGCSSGGNAAVVRASDSESSAAPPTPCSTLPATSTSSVPAAPATSEPIANRTMPHTKTRRRPTMSPSRPAVTTVAARVSR